MVGWAVGGNWSIENDLSLPLEQSRLTTPAHLTPSYQHLIFSTLLQTPDIFSSLLNPGIIYSTTLWHSPLYCKKLQHLVFSFLNKGSLENKEKAILVSENGLFLTLGWGTSSARNENLRPLTNTNIPLDSGKYGLRNHFWPLESCFLMRKSEKKGPNLGKPSRGKSEVFLLRKSTFSHISSWENNFPVVKSGFWGHISH